MNVTIKKYLFIILGMIFLVISYFGIVMPGVPAIPFILLSAWFFLQSSEKLYKWLGQRKYIGSVINKYFNMDKISKGAIWFVISQLWVSLLVAQLIFPFTIFTICIINISGLSASIIIYKLLK